MQYQDRPQLVAALRRIEGQARGIQRMIESGRECADVVRQLSAMRAATDRLSHRVVSSNLQACFADAELGTELQGRLENGLRALTELRS